MVPAAYSFNAWNAKKMREVPDQMRISVNIDRAGKSYGIYFLEKDISLAIPRGNNFFLGFFKKLDGLETVLEP